MWQVEAKESYSSMCLRFQIITVLYLASSFVALAKPSPLDSPFIPSQPPGPDVTAILPHKSHFTTAVGLTLVRRVSPGSGSSTASHFSFLPSVKVIAIEWIANLIPIQTSAHMLSRLYGQIVERTLGEWIHQPEVDTMVLTVGDIQLGIHAIGGKIPWDLVASFASTFYEYTNQGLVSTYRIVRTTMARSE